MCIANSQQYLCIAQLTFYSEAVPTADVGQQDGVAPTELEGLRYEVNVKNISMITNGSTASFIPLTCSSQNITWQSARTPIQVQPLSQPTGSSQHFKHGERCVVLVFHLVHSRAYCEAKQHICRRDDGGKICSMATLHSGGVACIPRFHDPNGYRSASNTYGLLEEDEVFHYSALAKRISRNRFLDLHRYLHFVDNSTLQPPQSPGYDKLGKVRPIINVISDCLAKICLPGKKISIDEAMIAFKGRSSLKQYMPQKPVKRGIKCWVRADAVTGYVSAFEVYTGRKGDSVEKGLGANVVKSLCESIYHTKRHIYFDNFFSSVDVALDLLQNGLYSCGTVSSNRRRFPTELKKHLKKGVIIK